MHAQKNKLACDEISSLDSRKQKRQFSDKDSFRASHAPDEKQDGFVTRPCVTDSEKRKMIQKEEKSGRG